VAAFVAFVVIATANTGTYRFGVSDQAFYIPVVLRALDPAAFPRDAALIDAQGRLMLADEVLAAIARTTLLPLETLFLGAYLLSLACLWVALVLIGRRLYVSRWTTLALIAAFSLRHQITRTSANSLEGYFHPRVLAFAIGLLAVAAFVRRRHWTSVALVLAATAVHVTTGAWFGLLIGVALAVTEPAWRRAALVIVPIGIGVAAWALLAGPLSGRLVTMDEVWLKAVASKDTLFATRWPLSAWGANLGLLAVLWIAHRWRAAHGQAAPAERGLVWGATALVLLFLLTLPAVAERVALAVQLQISRVFWLVDALATILAVGALAEAGWMKRAGRPALAAGLCAIAAARGAYIYTIEHPERGLFSANLAPTPWTEAMHWVAAQPLDAHVLADPGHAWRYGTSVRVSGQHDVFLEETKDAAIAIYSRDVAVRVVERMRVFGGQRLSTLETAEVQALAERYGVTYVVTEGHLQLPLMFENRRFRIYALSPPARLAAAPASSAAR